MLLAAFTLATAQDTGKDPKIDRKVRRMDPSGSARVLVILANQPQADALRKAHAVNSQRRRTAEIEVARLNEVTIATRQGAAARGPQTPHPAQTTPSPAASKPWAGQPTCVTHPLIRSPPSSLCAPAPKKGHNLSAPFFNPLTTSE